MKINFTSLMYFQKVAELEHLTKAAEAGCVKSFV